MPGTTTPGTYLDVAIAKICETRGEIVTVSRPCFVSETHGEIVTVLQPYMVAKQNASNGCESILSV